MIISLEKKYDQEFDMIHITVPRKYLTSIDVISKIFTNQNSDYAFLVKVAQNFEVSN